MVGLGLFFILLFAWPLWAIRKEKESFRTTLVPLGIHPIHPPSLHLSFTVWLDCGGDGSSALGCTRRPSSQRRRCHILRLGTSRLTFFLFLALFTVMLIAELSIMFVAIKKGPRTDRSVPKRLPIAMKKASSN